MAWEVEYTQLFETWWDSLSEDEQVEISAKVVRNLAQCFLVLMPT